MLNYIGPNNGEGIRIYYNGKKEASSGRKLYGGNTAHSGRIIAGRFNTEADQYYTSVQVDELIFFDQSLTLEEINMLATILKGKEKQMALFYKRVSIQWIDHLNPFYVYDK